MPNAKTYGFGASATNYCCPTDELVRAPITGRTAENQCAACYKTALSNCRNYGEYPFFQFCIETRWVSDGVSAVNENLSENTGTNTGTNTGANTDEIAQAFAYSLISYQLKTVYWASGTYICITKTSSS